MFRLLIVDNYDSFTWNLAHAAASITGELPIVMRNDEWTWQQIDEQHFDAIIISPGPGHPANARDFGVSADVIRHATVPVLGVCLGHQGIAQAFGGEIVHVEPVHGYVGEIEHDSRDELFADVPTRFNAVRYHSLAIAEPLPPVLRKIAWTADGAVMALRHITRPLWGLQFHPESILTEYGIAILRNFLRPGMSPGGDHVETSALTETTISATRRGAPAKQAPADLFRERFNGHPYAFWLDTSLVTERSRHSFMGSASEIVSYRAATRQLTITRDGRTEQRTQTLFDYLDSSLSANRTVCADFDGSSTPFQSGYVGYFGYELRSDCGSPVTHASPFPDALLMRVDNALCIEHAPGFDSAPLFLPALDPTRALQARLSRPQYLDRIRQCLTHIAHGEAYELCLTNHLDFPTGIPPLRYYETLRRLNPAPYSAYLRFGDLEIACSSPECFLRIDGRGRVESRPIKGTVPRGRTPAEDARLRHTLATDLRYRAENLMITDLVRHDLGRVAQPASVRVPALMEVESYATVHQLVSTITAQLRPGVTAVDCLRAAFPGGSMTGAPKLRAMELLDRLEPAARGIYSGSIGYLGFDGSADLNIVIRTAVFHKGRAGIGIGGAIVAQSDPEAEWEETQLKAAALLRAFDMA